jgi:hypothetical protein
MNLLALLFVSGSSNNPKGRVPWALPVGIYGGSPKIAVVGLCHLNFCELLKRIL